MNLLQFISVFIVLLFETIVAVEINVNEENVSFSVDIIWQSYKNKNECTRDDWKEGVQQYYKGSSSVAKKLSDQTYDEAETVITTFETYLKALSKLNKIDKSPANILKQFEKALPQLTDDYTKIVSSLSKVMGELTCPVNDALIDLAGSIAHYIKEFFKNSARGFRNDVDFQPVIKHYRGLINTIALITETALAECDLATPSVYEALTVLSLILIHLLISVQGVNICTQEILYLRSRDIPMVFHICLLPMNNFVKEMTNSLVSIALPLAKSITAFLTKLMDLTIFLNSTFDELFGLFEGVTLTVGQITRILSKSPLRTTNVLN